MRHESDWWLGGFLAAFLLGLGLTLLYTWYLVPNTPPTTPANLNPNDKDVFTLMIAAGYRRDGNLQKAQSRLKTLNAPRVGETLAAMTRRYIEGNADPRDIRSLATLADALGNTESYMLVYLATATGTATPTPTRTPSPTPSTAPTRTPTVSTTGTPHPTVTVAAFRVVQSIPLCDSHGNRTLRIYVNDASGNGIAGAKVLVRWAGGENTLFTGIKSPQNPGYADFTMDVRHTYRVSLADANGDDAENINIAETQCANLSESIVPSWQIVIERSVSP